MPQESKPETEITKHLDTINRLLKQYRLLLESDKQFPSVVGTIMGQPVRGSWWGHPKGMLVYNTLKKFSLQPGVLTTKLLAGKTTFVNRPLWPPFLTVATSREPWQTNGLSTGAKRLLIAVESKGELRTDQHSKTSRTPVGELGEAARELEKRLLVYGEGFHSDIGSHAKRLETWDHWAAGRKYQWNRIEPDAAQRDLEKVTDRLQTEFGASPPLPWRAKGRSEKT